MQCVDGWTDASDERGIQEHAGSHRSDGEVADAGTKKMQSCSLRSAHDVDPD